MNDNLWYYALGTERQGPVSWDELQRLATSGQLKPLDLIWCDGMPDWLPAEKTPGLFAPSPATAASPPPPPPSQSPPPPPNRAQALAAAASRAATSGAKFVQAGARLASRAVGGGAGKLRQTFGGATATSLGYGAQTLRALLRHPFVLPCVTLVFLLASVLAFAGIATSIFFPMFAMGYLVVVRQVLKGEPVDLGAFISFLRHGWNTLWHLIMLLAAFLITVSLMLAPLLLMLCVLYACGGTAAGIYTVVTGSGGPPRGVDTRRAKEYLKEQAALDGTAANRQRIAEWTNEMDAALEELGEPDPPSDLRHKLSRRQAEMIEELKEMKQAAMANAEQAYESWKQGSFTDWQEAQRTARNKTGVFTTLWRMITGFVWRVAVLIGLTVALFPACAAAILFFYLVLDVSAQDPNGPVGFDLVYNSFTATLGLGRRHWTAVVANGFFVAGLFAASLFVLGLIAALLSSLHLVAVGRWFETVAVPVYGFGFLIYITVFAASVCLKFRERVTEEMSAATEAVLR